MDWKKLTKAPGAENEGKNEWVNVAECITIYTDDEGTWLVQNDDSGSLLGPYSEKPEDVVD